MQYPTLTPENVSRDFIDVFGGYNHNPRINDNEFYDMKNMTSSAYPMIATRPKRGIIPSTLLPAAGSICGALYRSAFYVVTYYRQNLVDYLSVYKDGTKIAEFNNQDNIVAENVPRKLIMMGAYLIIFPDKVYVNVEDANDKGLIEAEVSTEEDDITVSACLADGTEITIDYVGDKLPAEYDDGFVWVDTSQETPAIKRYVAEDNVWLSVVFQYVRFTNTSTDPEVEISAPFEEGDGVKISGAPFDLDGTSILAKKPDNNSLVFYGQFESTGLQVLEVVEDQGLSNTGISPVVYFQKLRALCDRKVTQNLWSGKNILIGDQKIEVYSNTAAGKYEYWVDRNLSMSTYRDHLLIKRDNAWNSSEIWHMFTAELNESGESLRVNDPDTEDYEPIYVAIGSNDRTPNNVYKYMHRSGDGGRFYLQEVKTGAHPKNNKIYEGTKLYPVKLGDSMGLYETTVKFITPVVSGNQKKVYNGEKKILLDPEYIRDCEDEITFSRKMPVMDANNVIESQNRLWGCHYGQNADGDMVNEIYISKLNDFKNWYNYGTKPQDSYAVSVGTDGPWTGAVDFLGHPIFFKENYIHTVYGNTPSSYQVNKVSARGVQAGSSKSIAILKETLYYMSRDGVCIYDGSLPSNISYQFGDQRYHDAVACAFNGKYYICFKDANEYPLVMVYDSNRGVWHKEDNLNVTEFCPVEDDIYYIEPSAASSQTLRSVYGSGGQTTTPVPWHVETGWFGLSEADKKYISRLNVRLSLDRGANAIISIQYDNSGVWERLCNVIRRDINPFTVPIKPKRCDHFKLRFEGAGKVTIYSIAKTIAQGSDK